MQVSLFTLSVLGIVLLFQEKRLLCTNLLFLLVALSSAFNLLEELNITRSIHLVTPVFILGLGPAVYLAIRSVLGETIDSRHLLHFVPMFIALPFTGEPQWIILIGTFSRCMYGVATLKKLYNLRERLAAWRSDAEDLSFNALFWWTLVMSTFSVLDLVRLNFQMALGYSLNVLGQGISTLIAIAFFAVLLKQLVQNKSSIISLIDGYQQNHSAHNTGESTLELTSDAKQSDEYLAIYGHLVKQIVEEQWFKKQGLTLHQLSELTGLQSRDISRAINIHAQTNFNEFINQHRVNYVIERIVENTGTPLLSIAMDAGFGSKTTFNNMFRQIVGKTPTAFKRAQKFRKAESVTAV